MTRRVAVIGGGIAGLAAAHRLMELGGCEVTLLEAAPRLGGALHTEREGGYLIEHGADSFITTNPAAVELCRRIGFEHELVRTREGFRTTFVVRRGRLRRVPEGFLLLQPRRLGPMLTTPILSPLGKLRLLCEALVPRRRDGVDESLASFARRRLGRETYERLVQPLVGGIYTADGDQLSLAATLPRFVEMERRFGSLIGAAWRGAGQESPSATVGGCVEHPSDPAVPDHGEGSGARYGLFVAPRDGMGSLVAALASRLPADGLRLGASVERVSRGPDGRWQLAVGQSPAGGEYHAVVLAVPAFQAATLVRGFDAVLADDLDAIPYASSVVAVVGYRRGQLVRPLDGFGVVVPEIEQRRVLAISAASVKFPGRAPDDRVLLRVFMGGALHPEIVDLPDETLRRTALEELADLLGARGEPELFRLVRWRRAMPQYQVGHLARVARIEARDVQHGGLALAGSAFGGVGVPDCVASGQRAAERVHSALRSAS